MKLNLSRSALPALVLLIIAGVSGPMVRGQAPQAVGTWAPLATVANSRVGAASAVLTDGRTVITGGYVDGAPTASIVVYNPLDHSFATAGAMSAARVGHTATVLADGRVLIAGGTIGDTATADSRDLHAGPRSGEQHVDDGRDDVGRAHRPCGGAPGRRQGGSCWRS